MGIFNRARDVFSANLNSMLEKAENPEKMIRMIVADMDDVLIDLKAACSGAIADRKRLGRMLDRVTERLTLWSERAQEAARRGRDDLAREALREKRRLSERIDALRLEMDRAGEIVDGYRSDMARLDERLEEVRTRERVLVQRHRRAGCRRRAAEEIRRFDTSDALARFEAYEYRLDRMEAQADLVTESPQPGLDEKFRQMVEDEQIDDELATIKANLKTDSPAGQAEAAK